ncbi:hypothetical protein, partial [Acidaminococcus fermentans]|uniref:hypothetical protein n=1 Tax=Acidaminococcus fermentans TaxID=905 RepID=UPI00265FA267
VGHFFPALWVNYSPALTTTAIWDEWANRNLVVYHGPSPVSDAAFYIRITAYDKKFPNSR